MKRGYIYLILVVMIITHGTSYYMGANNERVQNEKEIDLTFEAAAQQYKTYDYDSTKFDHYGNRRTKEDTLKRVLPQNSRTEYAKSTDNRNKEQNQQTRKRD